VARTGNLCSLTRHHSKESWVRGSSGSEKKVAISVATMTSTLLPTAAPLFFVHFN